MPIIILTVVAVVVAAAVVIAVVIRCKKRATRAAAYIDAVSYGLQFLQADDSLYKSYLLHKYTSRIL